MLLTLSFTLGAFSTVWIVMYPKSHTPTTQLDEPLSLGNNVRRSYTLRTRDKELDVIEFVSDRGDYCVAVITEVTISGAQSVSHSCLRN
jgi:hypothetical protein